MTVIDLILRKKGRYSGNTQYYDKLLEAGAITINQDAYTAGLDRVYDVKGLKNMHVEIENTGLVNELIYKIEKARKEFDKPATLVDGDFDEDIKGNTNVPIGVNASGTITCVGALAGDTVTVNGLLYTAVAGVKANNTEFSIDTGDNETATDLADSIDDDTRIGTLDDLTATATTNVVTAVSTVSGTSGNAITLVSSDGTRLAVSGATFSGGVNNTIIDDIVDISPESTAIRIRIKRDTSSTTLTGIVSAN